MFGSLEALQLALGDWVEVGCVRVMHDLGDVRRLVVSDPD